MYKVAEDVHRHHRNKLWDHKYSLYSIRKLYHICLYHICLYHIYFADVNK